MGGIPNCYSSNSDNSILLTGTITPTSTTLFDLDLETFTSSFFDDSDRRFSISQTPPYSYLGLFSIFLRSQEPPSTAFGTGRKSSIGPF
jgi:hypothetical protein